MNCFNVLIYIYAHARACVFVDRGQCACVTCVARPSGDHEQELLKGPQTNGFILVPLEAVEHCPPCPPLATHLACVCTPGSNSSAVCATYLVRIPQQPNTALISVKFLNC